MALAAVAYGLLALELCLEDVGDGERESRSKGPGVRTTRVSRLDFELGGIGVRLTEAFCRMIALAAFGMARFSCIWLPKHIEHLLHPLSGRRGRTERGRKQYSSTGADSVMLGLRCLWPEGTFNVSLGAEAGICLCCFDQMNRGSRTEVGGVVVRGQGAQ